MNCRSAESLFSSYIEDEISQEERRKLEAHMMGCRRCSLSMREVRATMSILDGMPEVAPSAHFDEDVYARIRSGEGLRPTAAELIRELFAPARLRPVFMMGAGACAVLLGVMVSPVGRGFMHANSTVPPVTAPRPEATASLPEVAPKPEAVTQSPGSSPVRRTPSVVASAAPTMPATQDSIVDGQIPRQSYTDEIINDRFYIERGPQGQDPAVVPVNDTGDDGVYIVF